LRSAAIRTQPARPSGRWLADRAVAAGLVERRQDGADLRAVRLCRTADGADRLARPSALHLEELRRFAPQLEALWDGLDMSL
jgi:DNA-binding MarR family transcriptional regulator